MPKYLGRYTEEELSCVCGTCHMEPVFVSMISNLKERLRFPIEVLAGYRCEEHPLEPPREGCETHQTGRAIEVLASGPRAYKIVREALEMGFLGIGIGNGVVHLDMDDSLPRPNIWGY